MATFFTKERKVPTFFIRLFGGAVVAYAVLGLVVSFRPDSLKEAEAVGQVANIGANGGYIFWAVSLLARGALGYGGVRIIALKRFPLYWTLPILMLADFPMGGARLSHSSANDVWTTVAFQLAIVALSPLSLRLVEKDRKGSKQQGGAIREQGADAGC